MIQLRINNDKVDQSSLFPGKNGKYLNLLLFENKEGRDNYGNDGFVVQELSKEKRETGVKAPIIGNWKHQQTASEPNT